MLQTRKPLVVLVEDDPAVRGALAFAFETEGYAVASFASGGGVLEQGPWDSDACLIIDERLPDVSGLDLLGQLRARGVTAPAFLITTNPSAYMHKRATAAGVEIVEKPLLSDELTQKVGAALGMCAS